MRALVLSSLLLSIGCATAAPTVRAVPRVAAPVIDPAAAARAAVRLVGKTPSRARYQYVGRVAGSADTSEIVEAARTAQKDLRTHAVALGADVVKIDRVSPPPSERAPRSSRPRVLLAGRAYRAIRD